MKIAKRPKEAQKDGIVAKRFLLTIPHFDKLEEVYQILEFQSFEKEIKDFAVVLETHTQDPKKDKHLHIFVCFNKRRHISLSFFDFLGKHGKLERVRSIEAVLQYMNKENVCKANFDVYETLLANKATCFNTILRMLDQDFQTTQIIRKYSHCLAGKNWQSMFKLAHMKEEGDRAAALMPSERMRLITREIIVKRLSKEELKSFDSTPLFHEFIDIINKCLKYGNQHPHKRCCISIVGDPSIGKTTVCNTLKKYFLTYVFPMDGWHSQYTNGLYEIILWNEWDIKLLSRSDLLLFTEGEIVDLRIKYTKAVKTDRPLIILNSNSTFLQQVRKRYAYDLETRNIVSKALKVRIKEFDFKETLIWFLTKLFVSVNEDI